MEGSQGGRSRGSLGAGWVRMGGSCGRGVSGGVGVLQDNEDDADEIP